MNKLLNKISMAALAFAVALPVVGPHIAKAAADTDYASGTALISGAFTDNKSTTLTQAAAIGVPIILIVLFLAFLRFGRRQASGVFGGGRRR